MALKNSHKKILIYTIISLVLAGIYLNRSYAYIYYKIGNSGIVPVNTFAGQATFGNLSETTELKLVTIGDSLMTGSGASDSAHSLPYLLAQNMTGKYKKVHLQNFAAPGFRTADLIRNLLSPAINAKPQVAVVLIGVNDIHGKVSAEDFENNYRLILTRLTTETKAKIYIVSTPFIGANTLMLPPYQYYFDTKTKEQNVIIQKLAREFAVTYIDLYADTHALFLKSGSQYSADLFHPSSLGYKIWADSLYDRINH